MNHIEECQCFRLPFLVEPELTSYTEATANGKLHAAPIARLGEGRVKWEFVCTNIKGPLLAGERRTRTPATTIYIYFSSV